MDSISISIPKSIRDIKLGDWQKFVSLEAKNEGKDSAEFLNLKALQIFCGIELSESMKIPLASFDGIIEHLSDILSSPTPRVNRFKLIGTDGATVEFGLIPNLDEMSYGEYQDLESYLHSHETMHKAMAVLYRPLAWSSGDRYLIHEYKGTDKMADVMREMPVDIALGARVFFYRLAKKLQTYTMDSLLQGVMEESVQHSLSRLEKNGGYTNQY